MCDSTIKAAMPEIIYGTAALTSFQDSQSYVTFLFSEWRMEIGFPLFPDSLFTSFCLLGDLREKIFKRA